MPRAGKNFHALFRPLSRDGKTRQKASPGVNPDVEAIWHAIASIPIGLVSTYGDVARAAGLPGHARQTAYALRIVPEEMNLPWHRVMGAGGRIVFPKNSRGYREQTRRLKSEGVTVKEGRVPKAVLMDVEKF